jgi:SSS family solute:Na+ symporter
MIDQVIVAAYLIITLFIGLYAGRKTKNIKEYAIGKRDFSTLILLSAIFATVVDASDTMGLAGNTFLLGPIFLFSYMGMIVSRFLTAYLIAPKMGPFFGLISSGDILEKLFGLRAKTLMGLSTLIESTLLVGAQVLALSHISQYFFDIPTEFAAIIGSLFIVIYSLRGGIKSVTSTDVFQFSILIIAIPIVCGAGIIEIGGYGGLLSTINVKGLSFSNDTNMSYQAAMFISFSLPCLYPLCLQRMLMAKSPAQIKSAFIANGLLSIPFQLIVGTIGLIALILIPDIAAEHAFPALVDKIVPIGLKGLVIAGLLAVIMSTIDSILNVGAIALSNDLVGSLVKIPLKPKTSLRLVKMSSVFIAFGATIIAMRFTSIIDLLFYVLMLGNSVYFPGYFLGILGFHGSKKAFWIGIALGISTMIIGVFFLDMFILHVMLLAITLNASAHLLERLLKRKSPLFLISRLINQEAYSASSRYFFVNHWIKNQDYCSIFAICSIALSILPFFEPQNISSYRNETIFLTMNGITASISLVILFKEIWKQKFLKYFSLLWALLLIIALPLQSFFMFIRTGFSGIWLLEALVILPLLSMLTSRKGLIYSYSIGLVLACIVAAMFPSSTVSNDHMGQWAVLIHMITLAICLALFRQKDG